MLYDTVMLCQHSRIKFLTGMHCFKSAADQPAQSSMKSNTTNENKTQGKRITRSHDGNRESNDVTKSCIIQTINLNYSIWSEHDKHVMFLNFLHFSRNFSLTNKYLSHSVDIYIYICGKHLRHWFITLPVDVLHFK